MLLAILHLVIWVIVAVIVIKLIVWLLSLVGFAIPAQIERLFYILVGAIFIIDVLMILLGGTSGHYGFLP